MGVYFSRTCPRYFTIIYIITNKREIFIFAIFFCLVKMRPCKVSLCFFWHFNLNQINLQLPGNISIYYYSKKLYWSLSFHLKVIYCYRGTFYWYIIKCSLLTLMEKYKLCFSCVHRKFVNIEPLINKSINFWFQSKDLYFYVWKY